MAMSNEHQPTDELRQRITDLVRSGTPKYIISEIVELDTETITKHYRKELMTAKSTAIERIGKTVYQQALDGDVKSQALYLKTQGVDHGWIEKHVIETKNADEIKELKDTITDLEQKYQRDY